jgi:hypothetical protein
MTIEKPGYCAKGHRIRGANAVPSLKSKEAGGYLYNRCKICRNAYSARLMRERRLRARGDRMIARLIKDLGFFVNAKQDFPPDAAVHVFELARALVDKVNRQGGARTKGQPRPSRAEFERILKRSRAEFERILKRIRF